MRKMVEMEITHPLCLVWTQTKEKKEEKREKEECICMEKHVQCKMLRPSTENVGS